MFIHLQLGSVESFLFSTVQPLKETLQHEPRSPHPGGEGMGLSAPLTPLGTAEKAALLQKTWLPVGGSSCFAAIRRAGIFPGVLTPVWPWAFKATKYRPVPLTKTVKTLS